MATDEPGALLCLILGTSKHIWTWRDGDLYIYENALAAVPTTARELWHEMADAGKQFPTDVRAASRAVSADPKLEELLERPGSQLIPAREISEAQLRKGLVAASLSIAISNEVSKRWVWRPRAPMNVPIAEVRDALQRTVGARLVTG